MTRIRSALFLFPFLIPLALPVVPAGAGEPEAPGAPSAYELRTARLPMPSQQGAFSFEGTLVVGGRGAGRVVLGAAPTERGDALVWALRFRLEVGGTVALEEKLLCDRTLRPITGTFEEKSRGKHKHVSWEVAGGTLRLTDLRAPQGAPDATRTLARRGPFQVSVVGLLLFCHLLGSEEGTFETPVFKPGDGEFVTGSFTTGKAGTWAGSAARLVSGTRSDDKRVEAGFDAASGELLGAKFLGGPREIEFRRAEKGYFDVPAKTAPQAAAQAFLALAVADMALFERVAHWPSLHAAHLEANPDKPVEAGAFRSLLMAQLRTSLKPQASRSALAPMVEQAAADLVPATTEEGTVVTFGPLFRNMKFQVGAFDGVWYLVKLPRK